SMPVMPGIWMSNKTIWGCTISICDRASGAFAASPTIRWGNSGARSASNSRSRDRATGSSSMIKIEVASDISAPSLFSIRKLDGDPEQAFLGVQHELPFDIEGQRESFAHVRQRHLVARPGRRPFRQWIDDLDPYPLGGLRNVNR